MNVSSGIEGFDALSQGGYLKGGVNLICGVAGSGKTFFALHFLLKGLEQNEEVLFITPEEDRNSIERLMADMGIDESSKGMHVIDLGMLRAEKAEKGEGMIGFGDLKEFLEDQVIRSAPPKAYRPLSDS